jgi:serine/threonine-protein kinase
MAAKARAAAIIGTVISGRYRVVELLAMGGVGAVYLGEHVLMHKHVAIKVLHPDTQGLPDLVPRFEREAVAGAHIVHPNVAAATDFGQLEDGSYFLILEYVRGTTLREVIKRGPVPAARVARIGRQMAAGIGAGHAMGIIHRDVKPRNVMLIEGERDVVKIIDFGLAKLELKQVSEVAASRGSVGDQRITTSGAVFGTIAYLAPEAALGMDSVDERADLYALGLTLYELLAGRHPFDTSDPVELFRQHHKVRPPPIAERTPGVFVPAALEAIVMRLLEKAPENRYQTTDAVIAALDGALDVGSPTVPPVSLGELTPIFPGPSILPPADGTMPPGQFFQSAPPPPGSTPPPPPSVVPPVSTSAPPPSSPAPPSLALPVIAPGPPTAPSAPRRWHYAVAGIAVALAGAIGVAGWLSQDHGAVSTPGSAATTPGITAAPLPVAPLPSVTATESAATVRSPASAAPPTSATAAAAPAEPFDGVAARTMLRRAAGAHDWPHANEAFFALADHDPASFHDASLLGPARDVAAAAGVAGGPLADKVFEVLGQRTGSDGPDILYEIVRTRGGSKASTTAQEMLRNTEILARATPALRITVALRDAPCSDKAGLLDRAVSEGDARTLVVLQTIAAACLGKNPALGEATKALKVRLRGH